MAVEPNVKTGAYVGFKVGLQTTVDRMLAQEQGAPQAEHGCFYLTKDAHRLYIGNEDGSLSAVNEGIEWISEWDDLQDIATTAASSVSGARYLTGRFYYVNDRNILCVYNGKNWVQLNENSNTTLESVEHAVTANNNVATVSTIVKDDTYVNGGSGSQGYFDDSFTVTAANGLTITGSGKAITISGDTYTLSSVQSGNNVQLNLSSTNTNNDSTVTLVKGNNITLTRAEDSNNVTIAAKDTVNTSASFTSLSQGFNLTVTDTEGSVNAAVDPQISVKNADGTATTPISFVNGTAALDVYSTSAINSKLEAVNAMVYRGTFGSDGTAADSISYNSSTGVTTISKNGEPVAVSIGDTFLALNAGTYNGVAYKEGSLFIVRAKDGATENNGIIAAGDFILDVVAERYNSDTTYTLQGITNGVQLHASNGDNVGSIVVTTGDEWIDVAESGSSDKVLTITHNGVSRSDTENTVANSEQITRANMGTITVPAIVSVDTDNAGHVTGVTVQDYVLNDTNATLSSMATSTSSYADTTNNYSAGVVNTTTTLEQSDTTTVSRSSAVVFSSSSLNITSNDTRPTSLNGSTTPGGLQIEMVWGSF